MYRMLSSAKVGTLVLAMVVEFAPIAHASPEDPYGGEDWVALVVAPLSTEAPFYGLAGTQDEAVRIAMDLCNHESAGNTCYVATVTEFGCVAVAVNRYSGSFMAGRGPDENSAIQETANRALADANPQGFTLAGVKCSIPLTPP